MLRARLVATLLLVGSSSAVAQDGSILHIRASKSVATMAQTRIVLGGMT